MKISWGVKIVCLFVVFAVGIIAMVAISISKNIDLVSENYYEQEIKYQQHIDVLKSSKSLEDNLTLYLEGDSIILKILDPKTLNNLEGEIFFYRSSDAKKDFKVVFNIDDEGIQKIFSGNLDKGLWKIKVTLNANDKKYFAEKILFMN